MGKGLFKRPRSLSRSATIKLFIAASAAVALICLLYIGKLPYVGQPQLGKIADMDVYAPGDFYYEAGIDTDKTEDLKKKVALGVKDVYDIDGGVYENAATHIKSLFNLKTDDKLGISENNLKILSQDLNLQDAENLLLDKLGALFGAGIISKEEKETLIKQEKDVVAVRNPALKTETETAVKDLKTAEDLKPHISSMFEDASLPDKKLKGVLSEIASKSLGPNLTSNVVETSRRREEAIASVAPQKKFVAVQKGELIIEKGKPFTPFDLIKLDAVRSISVDGQKFAFSIIGICLIVIVLIIIPALYFAYYEPEIYSNNRHLILIAAIVVILIAAAKSISLSNLPSYFIPAAIGPMLVALLLGARPAIILAILTALLTGLVMGGKFDASLIFLVGSIVGIYALKDTRRRSQLFRAGVIVGAANALCVIGLGILNNLESEAIFKNAAWFFINGVATGAIITGTLHLFESLFQITTNITLLELADPNNPLLKELILKAPGTYHHSLIVGNLAESACDAIKANGLLARVGSYYHDIGKVEKSEYFSENQPITESQHDKLAPTMSSLIIINHVKEGVEKAKKAKLDKALIDFIEQHHGTGLIYYFYQRALESIEDMNKLEEEGFRYPGPKPQTKETAIVHLADSVEAASRALANPTPANLEEMVRRIINNKFIDGQLDECELTLKDLNIIALVFTKVLTSVYHTRIQYPNGKDKNGKDESAQ